MSDTAPQFALSARQARTTPRVCSRPEKLTAELAGGNLRNIRFDGIEVLRAISYLVRDRDWGTYAPALADLEIHESEGGFTISYSMTCTGPDGTVLNIAAAIEGKAEGKLTFAAEARSATGFETNRCGFCVLHPIVGLAGMPVVVEHVDGGLENTVLPDLIEPWQPFKDMRAITHTVLPGVTAACRMEGDTFEMEDQRNWSDASYKTYVRPLALAWPYQIAAHEPVDQRMTLTIADTRLDTPASTVGAASGDDAVIRITPGAASGFMPAIGLSITPEEAQASLTALRQPDAIGVQELVFHVDPGAGHGAQAFIDFAAIAAVHKGATTLEIAVSGRRPLDEEMQEIAGLMQTAGFRPDAIMVCPSVDRQSTPPGSAWPDCPPLEDVYAAAACAFAGIRLGGGMLSYFTELNRKRVPPAQLGFISHCTNPIVHAADDVSVMQTLEALPFITRSVRAIYGSLPYRIGPSTIAMRQNPYGSRTMDNPDGGRICMANRDPRHNSRFAEAFALGYAATVLDAGLECLTLSALTGPFGLFAGRGEPVAAGRPRPLHKTVALLARLSGARWQAYRSSLPSAVLAFATDSDGERSLHLVNITASSRDVEIGELVGASGRTTLGPFETQTLPFG